MSMKGVKRARDQDEATWRQAISPIQNASEVKERYHEFYDDPSADVVLVSKNGVMFRYYSHLLKKTR